MSPVLITLGFALTLFGIYHEIKVTRTIAEQAVIFENQDRIRDLCARAIKEEGIDVPADLQGYLIKRWVRWSDNECTWDASCPAAHLMSHWVFGDPDPKKAAGDLYCDLNMRFWSPKVDYQPNYKSPLAYRSLPRPPASPQATPQIPMVKD